MLPVVCRLKLDGISTLSSKYEIIICATTVQIAILWQGYAMDILAGRQQLTAVADTSWSASYPTFARLPSLIQNKNAP